MRYLKQKELDLASRYLFLSMAITVIRQDRKHMEQGKFKIKEPYMELLGKMELEARQERRKLRKQMDQMKLQVVESGRNDSFTSFLFLAHGYEEKRNYFNPAIRKKVENILFELMKKSQQSVPHGYQQPQTLDGSGLPE
ncbi:hypothetical protein SAMN05192559_106136 [Halobacillus karajensis]|uniref:Uncharacterized protein n=1 Tax=Halobacillus karajensis TaxID=195088 RepID=A0A024P815_9BACI|nr:hypothetical protein [Halobacillus karajensis]CDQ21080.1 hypothetical protein BN982_03443 [Halobacillus karajensis]CDQ24856.1 hypothetical protein BN983_03155 [Halobacillus karajensis]CDQ28784.1 hypothetical protein BN981_03099 [Halobacillus karajensis]SEH96437.1 hypothetical protein SAMN05192559_106136 [Halobacillus karajensis]